MLSAIPRARDDVDLIKTNVATAQSTKTPAALAAKSGRAGPGNHFPSSHADAIRSARTSWVTRGADNVAVAQARESRPSRYVCVVIRSLEAPSCSNAPGMRHRLRCADTGIEALIVWC